MLHDINGAGAPRGKIEDFKVDVKQMEHLNIMLYKRMASHIGHHENYFLNLVKHRNVDLYMTAKDAKKHKIANHLRIPTFDISIKLEMNLN